jgi:subtilisin family serine protease
MSFGYYHEEPDDKKTDATLIGPLAALAASGVALFASAGNDATTRRMYPAAFSTTIGVVSVGALNPNGTVALFSNSGDWVTAWDWGAQVLSTQPTTFGGSLEPTARTTDPWAGGARESLDPDDFTQGFATWSGTSFAAPGVAGRFLRHLIESRDGASPADALADPRTALKAALNELPKRH